MALTPLNATVLVAEDNMVNMEIARTLLEQLGCTVTGAENGSQAVQALAAGTFDLVLMDCHMPIMNGFDAAAQIRELEANNGGARVPIIALTASVSQEDRDMCIKNGMDDFLSKPFDKAQLHAAASQWLSRSGGEAAPNGPLIENGGVDVDSVPVLDQETIEMLRDLEGPHNAGILGRLIEVFVDDVKAAQPILRGDDEDAVRKAAHSLKSSAANMGALRLAELFLALETSADGAGPARDALVTQIEAAFTEVAPLLQAEMPEAGQKIA